MSTIIHRVEIREDNPEAHGVIIEIQTGPNGLPRGALSHMATVAVDLYGEMESTGSYVPPVAVGSVPAF